MLRYTLCLIQNGDRFLLLNRVKKPQMGMWNGVGGKIEVDYGRVDEGMAPISK